MEMCSGNGFDRITRKESVMVIARVLMLPFVWAFLAIMAVLMLVTGGLNWAVSGNPYQIRLTIGK